MAQDIAGAAGGLGLSALTTAARSLAQGARDGSAARALKAALGEVLSEPKPSVWFESAPPRSIDGGILLDRRTRMMYDAAHVFVNGESFRAVGRDAALLRTLADTGRLDAGDVARASMAARSLLASWQEAGWVQCGNEDAR